MRRGRLLLGILIGLVLAIGGLALFRGELARMLVKGPDPVTITDAALSAVQAQNKLTAFAARFTVAVTSTQERLGILSASKTLIVPGTVRYELDWKQIGRGNLAWEPATNTLRVRLPDPVIAGPEIDMTRIREYKDGLLLLALTDAEESLDAANRARAQEALLEEARAPVLMNMARAATREAVTGIFLLPLKTAGIDATVEIRFAGDTP